jgi:hypothetical protein
MRLGANHLVRGIVALAVCAAAIMLLLSDRDNRALSADRLSGWPSAQGKVIRIEEYTVSDSDGNKQTRQRAIVKFSDYDFKWNDPSGHRTFRLQGWFCSRSQRPRTSNGFHFARAVEASWSTHLFNRLAPSLRTAGFLEFKLGGYDRVRVGPGFLEFCGSGEVERCQADEIQSFKLHHGRFTAVSKHASAFSGQGKYSFDCQKCPNAGTFLLAVRTLVGWKE